MLETELIDSKLIEKNMKHFHQNQADVSIKTGKKGRKLKKNHSVEACKCFTPFVKLHWWDCPEISKPCPIHGNVLYQNVKPEKAETDQNVTISFHPSSRTEKLFEPVKSILAHCDPETKINLQYFSPKNFTDKENLKHQFIQTSFEDLRKNPSSNFFAEKKAPVYEKTTKMKKLRECFHSPCNSIAQKYPSPTPVRRNLNDISLEEPIQPGKNFFCGDISCGQNSEWFPSNPFGFKKLEKLTADKRDSDFITVTQHDKDNVINHKIFEIDHRKGINENPLIGFGKQPTQFAYSSFNVNYPNDTKRDYKYNTTEESKNPEVRKENINSRNSQISVSSAGSVYVTPFFLMPPGCELSDNDSFEEYFEGGKRSVGVQVKEGECECEERPKLITRYVQISAFESSDSASEQRMNTVSLQTDPPNRKKYPIYVESHESSEDILSEKFSFNEKIVQTNIRDDTIVDKLKTKGAKLKTTEVQTSNRYQIKEVLITRYNKSTKEAGNQVENPGAELHEGGSSTMNKSLMTQPSFANKKTQILTSFPDPDRNIDNSKLEEEESNERMDNERLHKYDFDSDCERRKDEKCECYINQTSSSRSPERLKMQDARVPREEKTSPVSDLSELKRIISEFFEKATCNCREKEYETGKKTRINVETMTESPKNTDKTIRKENMTSREIQTSEPNSKDKAVEVGPTQWDGGTRQYRQSVLLDDANQVKTNYICSFCGRNLNKFSMNASTNTEDIYAVKEKTTIIETDCTEITKVKKTTDPKNSSKKCITTSTKQTVRPLTYYKTDSQKIISKTVQAQTSSTRSNIPVPISVAPTPVKAYERPSRPFAYRDMQDCSRPDSPSNIRGKSSFQNERRGVLTPYKHCQCNEGFLTTEDSRCSPRSGTNYTSQRPNRSEDDQGQSTHTEDSRDKKESQKQPNRQFYPVIVNPSWPRDLTNSWKPQEMANESIKCNASQKMGFEKGGKLKETFSIKNFGEIVESQQEICASEKQNYPDAEKCKKFKASKKENYSFARLPSLSASQISLNKSSHYQSKIIKSEESVKTLTQQIACSQMRLFKEDANDLFTVKSCHLNPITIAYNGESCDKFIVCSNCKSLMLFKRNKNDDVSYVPGSNNQLQNQNIQSECEEKIPDDEVPERQMHDKYSLLCENEKEQEEYAEKCSNFSDTTNRTIENDFFKEENTDSDN